MEEKLIIKDGVLLELNKIKYPLLKNVKIPSNVKVIGEFAFKNCLNLESIEIPDSVEVICNNAFEDCFFLKSVQISKNIKEISNNCFLGCKSLENIDIPNGVTRIGIGAFADCISLKKVNIPKSVKVIKKYAFSYCFSIKKVDIPTKCYIDTYAFYVCKNLQAINLHSIYKIEDSAFSKCRKLKKIKVNATSKFSYIDLRAFEKCGYAFETYHGETTAYKAFYKYYTSKDKYVLCCRGFVYEEGKTYATDKAILCECGFHACINILDVFNYYAGSSSEIEIHEVQIGGKMDWCGDDSKICCTEITIGRKLSIHDVFEIFNKQQLKK